MIRAILVATMLVFIVNKPGFTYPQFIGKGYHACLTCHYNPFGNGPLNDYGRGVAASGLAGRFMIPESVTDEMLGNSSSIILGRPDKLPVKPSLDYRGLYIQSGLEQEDLPDPAWINMQAEFSLSANWGKRKQYVTSVSYNTLIANSGVSQNRNRPRSGKPEDKDISYLREYYFGYRVSQELGVYVGKMGKLYGIRIPDHNLRNRSSTRNSQYSEAPGVVVHYGTEKMDTGFQIFGEDETEEENEKNTADAGSGISSTFEYSLGKNWRLGVSYLNETEKESETKYDAKAFHFRTRVGENSSVMFEYGLVDTEVKNSDPTTAQYIYLQSHMYLKRGLFFVTTYDQIVNDIEEYNETHRFGPGIQWYPLQRFEFRADILTSKSYSSTTGASRDSWQFLGQVHLWL